MEFLQNIVDGTNAPLLAAFVLGLMTAISPCPLATNITATAYLSKDIGSKRRVLLNGVFYTLGRMFSYTAIGVVLFFGASQFALTRLLQNIGGVWLGVALIVFGVLMLDVVKIRFLDFGRVASAIGETARRKTYWDAFLLGVLFALAFCPYSGVLYFGVLIPMTIASPSGLLLPPVFAIATGLPVIIIACLLAYSVGSIGTFYNRVGVFQKWFKRVIAVVFIGVGVYYVVSNL
jgi:cytochrome c biogenesis protein CcdA